MRLSFEVSIPLSICSRCGQIVSDDTGLNAVGNIPAASDIGYVVRHVRLFQSIHFFLSLIYLGPECFVYKPKNGWDSEIKTKLTMKI